MTELNCPPLHTIPEKPEAEDPETDLSAEERFLRTVEGDFFSDIVTRACVLDAILKAKILTKAQIGKVCKLRKKVEKAEKTALPAAIGACVLALDDLDGEDLPDNAPTPMRDGLEVIATEIATQVIEKLEKKRPTRSEKLGPLSYPLF